MSEAARDEDLDRWRLPLSSDAAKSAPKKAEKRGFWQRSVKPESVKPDPRFERAEPAEIPFDPPVKPRGRARAAAPVDVEPREKPKRIPASRRSLWQSPLTRRILALNIMALLVPVLGLLYLPTYRDSLLQSELELLKTEGKLFSGALAASGVVTGPVPLNRSSAM